MTCYASAFENRTLRDSPMAAPELDPAMLEKLAGAVFFICGATHACTLALKKAAESGDKAEIKRAYAQFKKLKSSEQAAALNMIR